MPEPSTGRSPDPGRQPAPRRSTPDVSPFPHLLPRPADGASPGITTAQRRIRLAVLATNPQSGNRPTATRPGRHAANPTPECQASRASNAAAFTKIQHPRTDSSSIVRLLQEDGNQQSDDRTCRLGASFVSPDNSPKLTGWRGLSARIASMSDREELPRFIAPMLLRSCALPAAPDSRWVLEVKWDGIRAQVRVDRGRLTLRTRPGRNAASEFPGASSARGCAPGASCSMPSWSGRAVMVTPTSLLATPRVVALSLDR